VTSTGQPDDDSHPITDDEIMVGSPHPRINTRTDRRFKPEHELALVTREKRNRDRCRQFHREIFEAIRDTVPAAIDRLDREAFWLADGVVNRCSAWAYMMPRTDLPSYWPLINRISVNVRATVSPTGPIKMALGIDRRSPEPRRWICQPSRPAWRLELSCEPKQLLDFVPWVAGMITGWNDESVAVPTIPHGVVLKSRDAEYLWTPSAWAIAGTAQRRYSAEREARWKRRTGAQA
jgi:hypothetical protein